MKKIDVVELYVKKRIEQLNSEQGEYKMHDKEINELRDVMDVITQTKASDEIKKQNIEIGEPIYNKNLTMLPFPRKG